MTEYKFHTQLKSVGHWEIGPDNGAFCIHVSVRPNAVHRFFMRLLLGIKWRDTE